MTIAVYRCAICNRGVDGTIYDKVSGMTFCATCEVKRFQKRLNDIGSNESHIDRLYALCEQQALEIAELRAKFELLEKALMRATESTAT
jgi:DNA-directed RNA polymerase subunit RPC12/RpoP